MVRHKVRFRFRKEGDLRLVSHRDLLRTMERLFRRVGLPMSMSEGFRPRPRMAFPAPLAVGVVGLDEVMELELSEERTSEELLAALAAAAPSGLSFTSAEVVPPGSAKPQVRRVSLEVTIPEDRIPCTREAVAQFVAQTHVPVQRADSGRALDLRPLVDELTLTDDVLRMTLGMTPTGSARPREVLAAIGAADLESRGVQIVRTRVELTG